MTEEEKIIDACADDFLEAFADNREQELPPAFFFERWHKKGLELPCERNLHSMFEFFHKVIRRAKEKDEHKEEN